MGPTNIVAEGLEKFGVRTFSAKEMAFNILGLMHPLLFSITQVEPIWADLNGGMDRLPDLADITGKIRSQLNKTADIRRAVTRDNAADYKVIHGVESEKLLATVDVQPRANFRFDFPALESAESLQELSQLRGMLDLDKVIVITGFAEVGPWGSSRTRWEMEARGELTIEGCIEMAWIMGFIKHFDGRLKDGGLYVGWVDTKSGEPVEDKDVKSRYEKDILTHAGVRLIGECSVQLHWTVLTISQNLNCSVATTLTRRSSPRRSNSRTISSHSRLLKPKRKNSSCSTATNAISGPAKVANGSRSPRLAPTSTSTRPSSSAALSLDRFLLAGMLVATAFQTTSLVKLTDLPNGLLSALPRPSSTLVSLIPMSCINTCTPPKLEPVSEVVWVV